MERLTFQESKTLVELLQKACPKAIGEPWRWEVMVSPTVMMMTTADYRRIVKVNGTRVGYAPPSSFPSPEK